MKKLLFVLFIGLSVGLLVISCQSKGKQICKEDELDKIRSYSTTELVNYMCDGCRGKKDFKVLSNILNVSTTSLEKMRDGEITPTPGFDAHIRVVATRYVQHGCSIDELQKSYNNSHDKFAGFECPTWLKVILIILDILFLIVFLGASSDNKGCLIVYFVLNIVIWTAFFIFRA